RWRDLRDRGQRRPRLAGAGGNEWRGRGREGGTASGGGRVVTTPARTEVLVQTSCIWEVVARKVGNVHRHADLPGTSVTDFLISAAAIAPHLRERSRIRVGNMIHRAATATAEAIGQN